MNAVFSDNSLHMNVKGIAEKLCSIIEKYKKTAIAIDLPTSSNSETRSDLQVMYKLDAYHKTQPPIVEFSDAFNYCVMSIATVGVLPAIDIIIKFKNYFDQGQAQTKTIAEKYITHEQPGIKTELEEKVDIIAQASQSIVTEKPNDADTSSKEVFEI